MICISIAQESRRLALADMLNAARQCDLLEVRLDRFGKAPDVGELLAAKPKPVIFSCRREQDGGSWTGPETDRQALLRQCIVSKADYVEIELDIADQIRPFPPAKRVISYTNLQETPHDLAEIYTEAQAQKPDIIKLVTLARTPEEAWPLLQILARPVVPTVVVGLGKPGIMLSLLGKKIGAPWTYAALERGMEAYEGQATIHDLRTIYHYDDISRGTRLVGVTGFEEVQFVTVAVLNAILAHHGLPTRCLPLSLGNMRLFRKVIETVKLAGVVVDEEHRGDILEIAAEIEPAAQQAQAADLLLRKEDQWRAYNLMVRAAITALESALKARTPVEKPLNGRMVAIVGVNALARTMAQLIKQHGGAIIVASHDRAAAQELAQALKCRQILFEALYSTIHDVLVVCADESVHGATRPGESAVHPGYLKPTMTVMDLTSLLHRSPLLREAEARGCGVVSPLQLLLDQLLLQARLITGKETPAEVLTRAVPELQEMEEEK